jgi:hypothetical protein
VVQHRKFLRATLASGCPVPFTMARIGREGNCGLLELPPSFPWLLDVIYNGQNEVGRELYNCGMLKGLPSFRWLLGVYHLPQGQNGNRGILEGPFSFPCLLGVYQLPQWPEWAGKVTGGMLELPPPFLWLLGV